MGTSQLEDSEGRLFCISKHMQLVGNIDCGLAGEVLKYCKALDEP